MSGCPLLNRVAADPGLFEEIERATRCPAGIFARLAEVEKRLYDARERLDKIVVLHDTPPWLYEPAIVEAFRAGLMETVRARPEVVRTRTRSAAS